jgi:hypothetical protein
LHALRSADVERIFVTQTHDAALDKALGADDKALFVTCPADRPSFADSLICGVQGIFDFYGKDELGRRLVMVTPCDIPFVLAEDFNHLIDQCSRQDADVFCTVIQSYRLTRAYPGRNFHSQYLGDLHDSYTLQCPIFVRGSAFDVERSRAGTRRLLVRGGDGEEIPWVAGFVEGFRKRRLGRLRRVSWTAYKISQTAWVVRRLLLGGHLLTVLKTAVAIVRRRLTMREIEHACLRTLNLKVALLESNTPKFSADIDSQRDLEGIRSAIGARTAPGAGSPGTSSTRLLPEPARPLDGPPRRGDVVRHGGERDGHAAPEDPFGPRSLVGGEDHAGER